MKRRNYVGLIIALALVCGLMAAPASAVIVKNAGGHGDALIFPFFDADKLNIVTFSNESDKWLQVHVRIRTGAHSVEGRDFPLIMSPGDMVVFSLTRQGYNDGLWRIDYSADPNNFQYVRIKTEGGTVCLTDIPELKNEYKTLTTDACPNDLKFTDDEILVDERYGYIEVIGEAVFDQGFNKSHILAAGGCSNTKHYVVDLGGGSYRQGIYMPAGLTLSDVHNVLSGKMYIMESQYGTGVAYNAVALQDFRTNTQGYTHRVENYGPDPAVIVTAENALINDPAFDDYTYMYEMDQVRGTDGGFYEAAVAVNNSWGSTLADGDSYLNDDLDTIFKVQNSVREVEETIRLNSIRGHYFGVDGFMTNLVINLPTKHHVIVVPAETVGATYCAYAVKYYNRSNTLQPSYMAEIWDTDEHKITTDVPWQISPVRPDRPTIKTLPYEVNILIPGVFEAGRFVLYGFSDGGQGRWLVKDSRLPAIALTYIDMNGKLGYMTPAHWVDHP